MYIEGILMLILGAVIYVGFFRPQITVDSKIVYDYQLIQGDSLDRIVDIARGWTGYRMVYCDRVEKVMIGHGIEDNSGYYEAILMKEILT